MKGALRVEMHVRVMLRAEVRFDDLVVDEIQRSTNKDSLYQRVLR